MKVFLAYSDMTVMPIYGCMDTTLGMGSLRAYAMRSRAIAAGVDWVNRVFPDDATAGEIARDVLREAPDVVAFGCYIWNRAKTRETCRIIKRRRPKAVIVVGGPEVPREESAVRGFFGAWDAVDVAVWGEGEQTFAELLKALLAGKDPAGIPGLARRKGKSVAVSAPRPLPKDLSDLPSPFLNGAIEVGDDVTGGHVFIETSRGCPFQCAFCNYHAGRRNVTCFPLKRLREELWLLKSKGFKGEIYITDPNVNLDLKRLREMFTILRDECLDWDGIGIMLELMVDRLDDACIKVLGGIPWSIVALGIQSTNVQTLRNVNRYTNLEKARSNIAKMLKFPNIQVILEFILGLPGDDYEIFKKSLDWCFSHKRMPRVRVFDFQVLPNMPLAARKDKFGIVVGDACPRMHDVVTKTDSFSPEDLTKASHLAAVCHMVQGSQDVCKALRDAESAGRFSDSHMGLDRLFGRGLKQARRGRRPVTFYELPKLFWETFESLVLSGPRPSDVLERMAQAMVEEKLLPSRRFFTYEMWELWKDKAPEDVLDAMLRFKKRIKPGKKLAYRT
ncbi:MAG: radical SAM protein [Elusimicrobiota bacterium]